MSEDPPRLPPYPQRDKGDAWVTGPNGEKFWGRYGASGLLVWHPPTGVLLQHRVGWSHFGGTWGLPGGARKEGESAEAGALREAREEAGVPSESVSVLLPRSLTSLKSSAYCSLESAGLPSITVEAALWPPTNPRKCGRRARRFRATENLARQIARRH